MLFTGKYEHSIDAKHRLAIPAEIRARLDPLTVGEAFYIIQGPNEALWLWPDKTFHRMAGDIEPSLAPSTALMEFDEITFPEARRLDIDSAGRIRVPAEMIAEARIGTKVLILGMRNHLEIWDPGQWEARRQEKAPRRGDIVQRARPSLTQRHSPHNDTNS